MDHKDRIELFFLPSYSPDLNPDEWVWKNVKHDNINRIVHAACDAFQLAVLRWQPFCVLVEALKRLRTKFRLVAMTNADRVALSCYAHALGDPFDDTVCADETGVAKPNPEFLRLQQGAAGGLR